MKDYLKFYYHDGTTEEKEISPGLGLMNYSELGISHQDVARANKIERIQVLKDRFE